MPSWSILFITIMHIALLFLILSLGLARVTLGDALATNSSAGDSTLIIDRCSTTVSGAKATLSIGRLQQTGDTYAGDYSMKISPYFFKNEKGKLAILVPADSLAKVRKGLVLEVIGTATETGARGKSRHIDAVATPVDQKRGLLKLWFMADGHKMTFETQYHFAEHSAEPQS